MLEGGIQNQWEKVAGESKSCQLGLLRPCLVPSTHCLLVKRASEECFCFLKKQQSKHPVMTESDQHFPLPPKVIVLLITSNKKYSLNSYN